MNNKSRFIVCGGDMRQAVLAESLFRDGHEVFVFAMGANSSPGANTITPYDIKSTNPDCVILPLPLSADDLTLSAPFSKETLALSDIFAQIPKDIPAFAGLVRPPVLELSKSLGITLTDYYDREELAVANAIPTAEGAIQIAMEELPFTIHNSSCLVIGYGRIGKILSKYLNCLGARVTVAARKYSDLAWINANGYGSLNSERLGGGISGFDLIFNTAPAPILTKELLSELKEDCLCIDLASKPGGIDFKSAGELGIKCIWALSLPGKVAPYTSGEAIKNTIYNILEERGRNP